MEKNLTQGSVLKNIMYFALPYLLSYFLQQLYGMADLYMIGMFGGVDGTTAVTNGSQVMYMLTVIIVGLAMGATVMIGKAVGGNETPGCGGSHWKYGDSFYGDIHCDHRGAAVCGKAGCVTDRYAGRSGRGYGFLFDHLLYRHSVYCGI